RVPQLEGRTPIPARRGEPFPVRAERQVATFEGAGFRIAPRVPDLDRPVRAGRGQLCPVGAEGDLMDRGGVALQREGFLGAQCVSNANSQTRVVQSFERVEFL